MDLILRTKNTHSTFSPISYRRYIVVLGIICPEEDQSSSKNRQDNRYALSNIRKRSASQSRLLRNAGRSSISFIVPLDQFDTFPRAEKISFLPAYNERKALIDAMKFKILSRNNDCRGECGAAQLARLNSQIVYIYIYMRNFVTIIN